MESILTSIKKLLGIAKDDEAFDADVIMHINSVFMILKQLGVGPSEGFYISDDTEIWSDFLKEDQVKLQAVKSYVYNKVKLLFDPPANSALTASIERQINEFEWRLNVEAENSASE